MFSKNAKFKLIFWGIMLAITATCGTIGAIKHYNDTKDERERKRISTKETSKIVIEGNVPSRADETELTTLVISILNDSKDYLNIDGENVTLSDKGKVTTTLKYLYLANEINLTDGIDDNDKEKIVRTSKILFGDYVKYEPVSINYSSSFCGSSGFDGTNSYGTGEKTATENCENPFVLFQIDKIRYDKDTYAALVYGAYVDEKDYFGDNTDMFENITCKETESLKYRTLGLYTEPSRNQRVYSRNTNFCCANGECKSGGIIKERTALLSVLPNLGNKYYLRFNKTSDGDGFTLVSITKTK